MTKTTERASFSLLNEGTCEDAKVPLEQYFLSNHVFLCQSNGQFVFLDLRNDEYVGLDRAHSARLEPFLAGCTVGPQLIDAERASENVDIAVTLERLERSGILTRNPHEGKRTTRTELLSQGEHVLGQIPSIRKVPVGVKDASRFLYACTIAYLDLKSLPIEEIVLKVQRRKSKSRKSNIHMSLDTIGGVVSKFEQLRVLFPKKYLCLFDSLALMYFLSYYQIFPSWIYGVAAEPFEAHCWVQYGDILLNESIDVVSFFNPIMIV